MSAAHNTLCGKTQALQYQFAAHLRDPQQNPAPSGIEERRLNIYRELFFNNIEGFLSTNFPVIRTLYNDLEWNLLTRAFYREHQCHTPLFPEIPREFMRYLETRQQRNELDPPFLLELAHYEWAELALSLDENDIANIPHNPLGDPIKEIPVVSLLAWRLGYHFPVHRIRPDYQPDAPPEHPTLLLLIRNREDQVSFLEIDQLTFVLLERLEKNSTLSGSECLDQLLSEIESEDKGALRQAGIKMLNNLKSSDALLGTLQ